MQSDPRSVTFERLVKDHHAAVYRSARRILRHDEDARDVTQEVFLEVLTQPDRFAGAEDPSRVLRWLAARKALAQLRGARHRQSREDRHAMERATTMRDGQVEEVEARGHIARLVDALPDELRGALVLRFEQGMTYADIAEAAACSEPTAHDRVKRGLERLRVPLERAGLAAFVPALPEMLASGPPEAAPAPAALEAQLLGLSATLASKGLGLGVLVGALLLGGAGLASAVALARRAPQAEPVTIQHELAERTPIGAQPGEGSAPREAVLPATGEAAGSAAAEVHGEQVNEPQRAWILGRLVDTRGLPLTGVMVEARSAARDGKFARYSESIESGEDGRFELRPPVERASGQIYRIWTRHPLFVTHRSEDLQVVSDLPHELGDLELLSNSADVAGEWSATIQVIDESSVPVVGVPLTVERRLRGAGSHWRRSSECHGVTDEAGRVELEGNFLGEKLARVQAHGQGYLTGLFEFSITRTGHTRESFVLERGFMLEGRVRRIDGPGAPDKAQVHAVGDDKSRWIRAQMPADGRFELNGLNPAESYEVHARADGYSPARTPDVQGAQSAIEFVLKREGDSTDVGTHMAELHGRVIDAVTGAPVLVDHWAVEEVWLRPEELGRSPAALRADHRIGSMAQRAASGEVQEDSADFHRVGLRPATYLIVAHVRGYAPASVGPFELEEGELVANIVVPLERGASLAGFVRDAHDRPVANAFVWLGAEGEDARTRLEGVDLELRTEDPRYIPSCVRTDDTGAFGFEHLPSTHTYRAGVLHMDHSPALGPVVELAPLEKRDGFILRVGNRR